MNWVLKRAKRITPKDGGSSLYGVVLYTDRHAHVAKVLNDREYWRGLEEATGPLWAVFATRLLPQYLATEGGGPPGTMGMMVAVYRDPADNLEVLTDFGMRDSSDLPCLVVFVTDENGDVYSSRYRIDSSSAETAYASMTHVGELVARAVGKMDPENRTSATGIRNAVFRALRDDADAQLLKKGFNVYRMLKDLKP